MELRAENETFTPLTVDDPSADRLRSPNIYIPIGAVAAISSPPTDRPDDFDQHSIFAGAHSVRRSMSSSKAG